MKTATATATLVLVNLAGIMERADESLLPGVYKEVGAALHADPTRLGSLTLFRSIVQSACYPLAAYLAARHNRAHVIALGAFLWAAATFLVAVSSTFAQVAISRGLNGIGLAIATPAIQSLVADSTDSTNRGAAFGWLLFTGSFGSILGNSISLLLAPTSIIGIAGWRLAFHLVALVSVAIAVLVFLFAVDPRLPHIDDAPNKSFLLEMKELVEEAKLVINLPSFQVLVVQGVFGMFPWSSLSFTPMWLELIGFSHETTATVLTLFSVAGAIGALFGGKMGDVLARRRPNSGRIMLSQISSASAIPLAAVLLLGLPYDSSTAAVHALVFFVMGLFMSWNAAATNNPIFAEIVPERARTSIYALDRSFESILASFAPPVVGILAQKVYGYGPLHGSSRRDRENARALGKALYTAIGIPMAICVCFYSLLYRTYPRDRDRAKMEALVEFKLKLIEADLHAKEGRVIDIDYQTQGGFDDEKRLLTPSR